MENIDNLIDELYKEIKTRVGSKFPEKTFTTLQTLKVIEELGEVADTTLRMWHTRKDKSITEEELKKKFGEEIADTIITLYTLAKSQNIDLKKHLKDKIKIEIERWRAE